jgi:CTP synthase
VEVIELNDHPYFVACQYHPEFLSRPGRPHPLFGGLIEAAQLLRIGGNGIPSQVALDTLQPSG